MSTPATNKQIPDNAILDHFSKQTYLGNRYSYALAFTISGTSEVAKLYLLNPALASGTSFPNQAALFVDLRRMTGATASANTIMRTYIGPTTVSSGSSQTPVNMRPASPNLSIATLKSATTAGGNGTLVETLSGGEFKTVESRDLIILDPGKSMLITLQSADAAVITAQIGWYEL